MDAVNADFVWNNNQPSQAETSNYDDVPRFARDDLQGKPITVMFKTPYPEKTLNIRPKTAIVNVLVYLLILLIFTFRAIAIELEIIDEIPTELQKNLKTSVQNIAPPTECIVSNRYKQRLNDSLEQAFQGLSYYQFEIIALEPEINVRENTNRITCDRWRLSAKPGEPLKVASTDIQLQGDGKEFQPLIRNVAAFSLKQGDVFSHSSYEKGKSLIQNTAALNGYFDAGWQTAQVRVSKAANSADIQLIFNTGERYLFGELVNNLSASDKQLIDGFKPFAVGEAYSSDQLNLFSQRLKNSGYFQSVLVRPLLHLVEEVHLTKETNSTEEKQVPLELVYKFRPKNEYTLGGGINSDTGPRVRASWKRARLNGQGHSVEAETLISGPEQLIGVRYRIPLNNPAKNFISVQSGFKRFDNIDTQSDILNLSVKRHWISSTSEWQNVAHLKVEQERFIQGSDAQQTTTLVLPGFTTSRYRSDGELYPMWGDRQLFTVEVGNGDLGSDIDIARGMVQSRWLREIDTFSTNTPLRVFSRFELGALTSSDFDQVPASLRFFAGGDQSIRGFGYQALSPLDEAGELTGGQYLYTFSAEVSMAITEKWRAAAFIDAGNASDRLLDDIATGIGAGIHWITPVGPVRLYVARGNSDIEQTWRLHFSLGAAL